MGNTASCVRIGESSTDSKLSDSKLKSERTKMTLSDVDGTQSRWNDAWLRNNSYHRSSSQRQNAGRPRGFEWERGDGRSPSGLRQAGTGAAARVMIPQYPPMIGSSQLSWSAFFLLIPPLVLVRPQNLLTFPSLVLIYPSPVLLFFLVLATKEGLFTNHFTFNLLAMTFPLCSFFLFVPFSFFFDPAVRSSGKFASGEQSRELPGSCINLPYRDHGNSCSFL